MYRKLPLLVAAVIILFVILSRGAEAETLTVGLPGSGAQYATVGDAVLASQPYDTILVFPGSYDENGLYVVHPLQIVGSGTPQPKLTSDDTAAVLRILPSPAFKPGDVVILADLELAGHPAFPALQPPPGLEVRAPAVVLGCTISGLGVIEAALLLDGCKVDHTLHASASELWINASEISGYHEPFYHAGGGAGTPAADLESCTTSISRSKLLGGSASSLGDCLGAGLSGAEGLRVDGGVLVLHGGPGSLVQGGDGDYEPLCVPPHAFDGGFALTATGGALVVAQLDIPLVGGMDGGGGQHAPLPVPSPVTFTSTEYPSLALAQPVLDPGTGTTLSLAGHAGPALLGMSRFAYAPVLAPGIDGAIHVDLARGLFFSVVLPSTGAADVALGLPGDPALVGLLFVAQLATAQGPSLVLSDPAFLYIR